MNRILLADDDIELTEMLKEYLDRESFDIDTAHDGQIALEKALQHAYDLVILDVMMPRLNGFDILRQLRQHSQVPVLILTARGDDVDSVIGLEIGADDYLAKPCDPRVLVAHMRAILRRSGQLSSALSGNEKLIIDDIELHRGTRLVTSSGEKITMTSTEYSVLEQLMEQAGQVVTKEQLSERVLGRKLSPYDRSLDMHISNLRKKLGTTVDKQDRIITVRGVGYQYLRSDDA